MRPDHPVARAVQRVAGSPRFVRIGRRLAPATDQVVHRLTGGRWTVTELVLPVAILTTTGARSGRPRTVTLATAPVGRDLYVVGSNFGQQQHPAWSTNLLAHPDATVEFRRRTYPVTAHLLDPAEKAEVWPRLTAMWPPFDDYASRSGRDLRVFRLSPA